MKYVVVNIGCIECGVSSGIVGLFDTEAKANEVAEDCQERLDWREGGQNHYEVFPLPEVGVIAEEYLPTTEESAQELPREPEKPAASE